jgi:hypothetical protein
MPANPPYPTHRSWRFLEIFFRVGDLVRFPKVMMMVNHRLKSGVRPLTADEVALARSVFGDNINYDRVRVDARSHLGPRHFGFAYVGFYFINCWGSLTPDVFIHELVHVWQYQRFGSVYIPRALYAQRTPEGYHYGGPAALEEALQNGETLVNFNYEQQAEIVADFFRLQNSLRPAYCPPEHRYLPLFASIIRPDIPL